MLRAATRPSSRTTRALLGVLVLGTALTVAQLTAAIYYNSAVLLADGLFMSIDDFAYAMNLMAEYMPERGRLFRLMAPAVSAALLLVVAVCMAFLAPLSFET